MLAATRFLLLCAAVIALPAITVAQSTLPPLPSGWYSNGSAEPFYENDIPGDPLEGLEVQWVNSYLYQYPGNDPLYWYAEVVYRNTGSKTLTQWCTDPDRARHDDSPLPGAAKEHIRGNANYMGYVGADETHCSRNPVINVTLKPGDTFYGWAIFHNVPWGRQGEKGEVSLEWGNKGSSPWAYPWQSPYPVGEIPPPAECPSELVTLGTCMPVSTVRFLENGQIEKLGEKASASNLIILVHGCCTDANEDLGEWYRLGRKIGTRLLQTTFPDTWELAVLNWTRDTRKDTLTQIGDAYRTAVVRGPALGTAIGAHPYPYTYVHLIGHSAGARLIHFAADTLQKTKSPPFIHLTFLDAYTPNQSDRDTYGKLTSPHFSDHYVDRTIGALLTDAILPNAVNFDITTWDMKGWQPISTDDKRQLGHQWPRYWYEKSVTMPAFTPYGYNLSFESSGITILNTFSSFSAGECVGLVDNDTETVCQ